MASFSFKFSSGSPTSNGFSETVNNTFTYTGPSSPDGEIVITDNGSGIDGQTLEDDNGGGSELATGTATIGGLTSTDSLVNAERAYTVRDEVTGRVFEVVSLEIETGDAAGFYTLSEVPLVAGRSYTLLDFDGSPDASSGDPAFTYAEYVCFGDGTLIATPQGPRKVESLSRGDLVETLDHGAQPLIWTGSRRLSFGDNDSSQKPIEIKSGSLRNGMPHSRLVLSPQHHILIAGPSVYDISGDNEAFAPDKSLLKIKGIRVMAGRKHVRYHSLMTWRHEVLFANGLPVESFWPGHYARSLLAWTDRLTILSLFPGISHDVDIAYGPMARRRVSVGQIRSLDVTSLVAPVTGHQESCC
ncbi:Hint domain-containing protein [Roseovarius phycicola]|uniref:Hint domain-containing protein n=1 Tax=Roseovarius phycicola TaxID=3080976 RepID=A0ABZ2HD17_9RHOB